MRLGGLRFAASHFELAVGDKLNQFGAILKAEVFRLLIQAQGALGGDVLFAEVEAPRFGSGCFSCGHAIILASLRRRVNLDRLNTQNVYVDNSGKHGILWSMETENIQSVAINAKRPGKGVAVEYPYHRVSRAATVETPTTGATGLTGD